MSKEVIYTQEQIEERCRIWQQRLGISDWRIAIFLVKRHEIEPAYGDCTRWVETSEARIRIVRPEDYECAMCLPMDMEQILVHELLHVRFASLTFEENSVAYLDLERGVDYLSHVLVDAYRQLEAQCSST